MQMLRVRIELLDAPGSLAGVTAALAAFELARTVLTSPGDPDAPGRALAQVAYADVGSLVDADAARRFPLARRALDSGLLDALDWASA